MIEVQQETDVREGDVLLDAHGDVYRASWWSSFTIPDGPYAGRRAWSLGFDTFGEEDVWYFTQLARPVRVLVRDGEVVT